MEKKGRRVFVVLCLAESRALSERQKATPKQKQKQQEQTGSDGGRGDDFVVVAISRFHSILRARMLRCRNGPPK